MIQTNPFNRRTAMRSDLNVTGGIGEAARTRAGGGSWVDAAIAGLGGLLDGGSGSEPPQGSPTVPGFTGSGGGMTTCPQGTISILGRCVDLQPGGATQGGGLVVNQGEAVLGQYGVALVPQAMQRTRLRCPRGMVLGVDDLCYNKRDLRKDERKWRPGRKPLLTGGELNAITTAARAARKLDRTKKSLRKTSTIFKRVTS